MKPEKFEREAANSIEDIEKSAWEDMYEAMPKDFEEDFEFDFVKFKNFSLCSSKKIPFGHFNSALGFGYPNPVTESELYFVLEYFSKKEIKSFYIHWTPNCLPEDFEDVMTAKGLDVISGWDRIVRTKSDFNLKEHSSDKYTVIEVDAANSEDWAEFIDNSYGLPAAQWLLSLVGRKGWHHYMLKEGSKIKAVRTAFIKDKYAWLGIDTPVPGIMTNDFEPDYFLSARITDDCIKRGAENICSVIEKTSAIQDTKAYYYWDKLGYIIAYYRKNYSLKK